MKKSGFTLVEIVSIIVVLAVIIIIGATITLPKMSTARDQAFRLEATKVVKASKEAVEKVKKDELTVRQDDDICQNETKYCFTVKELNDNDFYKDYQKGYSGKIEVIYETEKPMYVLYLKKNDEFKIIGGSRENYDNHKILTADNWQEEYEKCDCN